MMGMPVADIRAYTPYSVVAEKLEAMVALGEANSRMKDYFDLAALATNLRFDGRYLLKPCRSASASARRLCPRGFPSAQ